MTQRILTQEYLKEYFEYNPISGELIRKKITARCYIGDVAGTPDKDGYIVISVFSKQRKAHHLVWLYHHGYMPEMIDHKNRNPSDNRIENLRITNKSLNAFNSKVPITNTSGYKGVSWSSRLNKWHSYIGSKKTRINLGYFSDIEDAIHARTQAEKDLSI